MKISALFSGLSAVFAKIEAAAEVAVPTVEGTAGAVETATGVVAPQYVPAERAFYAGLSALVSVVSAAHAAANESAAAAPAPTTVPAAADAPVVAKVAAVTEVSAPIVDAVDSAAAPVVAKTEAVTEAAAQVASYLFPKGK